MLIGIIGTRYSGKSSVATYLKTRGFTTLHLRSGANEEDTSTAASSENNGNPDISHDLGNTSTGKMPAKGPVASTSSALFIGQSAAGPSDSLGDLSGETPKSEHELFDTFEWGSRTPESHVNRDELKDGIHSAFRRLEERNRVATSLKFNSPLEMLDYATRNWRSDFVTEDLQTKELLDPFLKRPFFLLLEVDAPLMTRFERVQDVTLQQFIQEHDSLLYGSSEETQATAHQALRKLANVTVVNSFPNQDRLWAHLDSLDLTNPERLRPGWDTYFMTLASLASQRSNCMKRRVGAILVRYNRILATGYNGTPRGLTNCNEGGCARCNGKAKSGEALDECLCLHAEENALLEAGRERVGDGAVLYCNTCPCLRCSVKIVQTGVKEVVYNLAYSMDTAAADVFLRAGVTLRQHTPPQS